MLNGNVFFDFMYLCHVKQTYLHKSFSVVMAVVVMFSTLSFTVESHYCGTRLVDMAVFTKAKGCGIETAANELIIKNCCANEIEVVKGQDELKRNDFEGIEFNQHIILSTFVYSYINLFKTLAKQPTLQKEYVPPNIIVDIQLQDDVFLI